jgi:hypothetical protein
MFTNPKLIDPFQMALIVFEITSLNLPKLQGVVALTSTLPIRNLLVVNRAG